MRLLKKKSFALYLQAGLLIPALLLGIGIHPLRVQASEGKEGQDSHTVKKRVYVVRPGECLSTIAMEVYGSGSYWVNIYDSNKAIIGEDPDYLQAGVYLELPEAPEKNLTWDEIYERTPWELIWDSVNEQDVAEEYEFTVFDTYISEDAPYEIEECYYYRNTKDEKYGKWEQEAGRYNICYPRLISSDGRDMERVNETIRQCAMFLAEEYYIDADGAVKADFDGLWRDTVYLRSTERYQITYLDENLLSMVFEHYNNNGRLMGLLQEAHSLECLTIDLKTGHVYTCEEIFDNTGELAEEEYARILQKHGEGDSAYDFFTAYVDSTPLKDTLSMEGWKNNMWKTTFFLDQKGVHLAFNHNVYIQEQRLEENSNFGLWKDYQVTDYTAEEIRTYQSDSELWQKWNKAAGSS